MTSNVMSSFFVERFLMDAANFSGKARVRGWWNQGIGGMTLLKEWLEEVGGGGDTMDSAIRSLAQPSLA